MNDPFKIAIWSFSVLAGIMVSLYFSSVTYYILNGLNPDEALPWSILGFIQYQSEPFGTRLAIAFVAPNVLIAAAIGLLLLKPKSTDSRWATRADIKKAGLFARQGLLLGDAHGKFLYSDSDTHTFVIAPSRSGKGVGVVIPNLLTWPDSFICLDIKKENHEITSGFRGSLDHKVINFSPFSTNKTSHCYNPFDYISDDPDRRITDLQIMATSFVSLTERGDPHFPEEAQDLFVGLALYILDNANYPSTIGSIFRLLGTEESFYKILRHIAQTQPKLHESARQLFNSYANKAEKERSGIKSTLGRALKLWRNPVIDAITSKSDFSFHDLRKTRHAIYLGVGLQDMAALAPLMRVFFEQAITVLTSSLPDPKTEPRKVLMLMDEFHILGNMQIMNNAFTLLAGYNIRFMGIVQDIGLLDKVYDKQTRDTILSNCAHQVFYSTQNQVTQDYISHACGEHTVQSKSVSKPRGFSKEKARVTFSEKIVPLIKPHDVHLYDKNKAIILVDNSYPIQAKKLYYYKEKGFKERLLTAAETPPIVTKSHFAPKFDIPMNKKGENDDGIITKKKRNKASTDKKPPSPDENYSSYI
jgi:type IV secretion system protein VirD4